MKWMLLSMSFILHPSAFLLHPSAFRVRPPSRSGFRNSKRLQHFVGVLFDVYFVEDLLDFAPLVNEEGLAADAHVLLARELLLAVDAVGICHRMVGVCEEREGEFVLVCELTVRALVVERDAEDFYPAPPELSERVAETASLLRASRRVVLRVEVEHDLLPTQIRQLHLIAFRVARLEVGRGIALFNHRSSPPSLTSVGIEQDH